MKRYILPHHVHIGSHLTSFFLIYVFNGLIILSIPRKGVLEERLAALQVCSALLKSLHTVPLSRFQGNPIGLTCVLVCPVYTAMITPWVFTYYLSREELHDDVFSKITEARGEAVRAITRLKERNNMIIGN